MCIRAMLCAMWLAVLECAVTALQSIVGVVCRWFAAALNERQAILMNWHREPLRLRVARLGIFVVFVSCWWHCGVGMIVVVG